MTKRKTLKQKKLSQERKVQAPLHSTGATLDYVEIKGKAATHDRDGAYMLNGKKVAKEISEDSLLVVDPSYIRKDILRTLVLSVVFISMLLALNWAIQYGKITL